MNYWYLQNPKLLNLISLAVRKLSGVTFKDLSPQLNPMTVESESSPLQLLTV